MKGAEVTLAKESKKPDRDGQSPGRIRNDEGEGDKTKCKANEEGDSESPSYICERHLRARRPVSQMTEKGSVILSWTYVYWPRKRCCKCTESSCGGLDAVAFCKRA